ncbi:DUF6907 domain-containing protein [Kineococcus sp. SYSU DK002]|uniref:DUF6907 domain-containing protein n=1 Tax=Kineococcus sp. SYSU DK002 TaxID=3383123 RepID=UPI003D7DDEC1
MNTRTPATAPEGTGLRPEQCQHDDTAEWRRGYKDAIADLRGLGIEIPSFLPPSAAASGTCPTWCTVDHSPHGLNSDMTVHSVTLLNQTDARFHDDYRLVQVWWHQSDERGGIHCRPHVFLDLDVIEAEMTAKEARAFAATLTRARKQPEMVTALEAAASIVESAGRAR